MSEYIDIEATDGSFQAYLVLPEVIPAPAVVVLQEIFGINADLKETCQWLAGEGFIAVCPDLFWRAEPGLALSSFSEAEWQKGLALYQAYDRNLGVQDIAKTLEAARQLPECSGKVAVMGFCLGGLMTFLTAAREEPDAAVAYYGGDTESYLDESDAIETPLLMHLAGDDEFMTKAAQAKIIEAVKDNQNVQVFTYPGCSHAFARNKGTHYAADAAALAHSRTIGFLNEQLA